MEKAILLRGARQLLTLHGPSGPRRGAAMRELEIIPDGAALIVDGIVRDVGPSRRVENLAAARDAIEISADGRVAMPGFIDCHTHLISGSPLLDEYEELISGAGSGENRPSANSLEKTLRELHAASKRRLEVIARKRLRDFIRSGTTTLEAKSPWGADLRLDLKVLRVLALLDGRPLDVFPTLLLDRRVSMGKPGVVTREPVEELCSEVLPEVRQKRLAKFVHVNCGNGGYSAEETARLLSAAKQAGAISKVTTGEDRYPGGVRVAVQAGAASVDHLEWIGTEDIELLARSQTVAALVPGAMFHVRSGRYAPARALIDAGAAVALATDFSTFHCPSSSMAAIISLACAEMQMTPAEAITAATINGAHALRCASRLGSIESGKEADLILLNASDFREIPYHFGMNLVAMVMKRGEVLFPRAGF